VNVCLRVCHSFSLIIFHGRHIEVNDQLGLRNVDSS
jgi:hypothetical protein